MFHINFVRGRGGWFLHFSLAQTVFYFLFPIPDSDWPVWFPLTQSLHPSYIAHPHLSFIHFYPEDGGTGSSKTLVTIYVITQCHNPDDHNINFHHHEILRSHILNPSVHSDEISYGRPLLKHISKLLPLVYLFEVTSNLKCIKQKS